MFRCPNCKALSLTSRQIFVDIHRGAIQCSRCGAKLEGRRFLAAVLLGLPIPLIVIPTLRAYPTNVLAIELVTLIASIGLGLFLAIFFLPRKAANGEVIQAVKDSS